MKAPDEEINTANQRYAISYWWSTVTMAVFLIICEVFSHTEVENRHFRLLYILIVYRLAVERNIIQIHRWKVHLLHLRCDKFSRCCFPNLRNHAKFREIRAYSSSRSSTLESDESANRTSCNLYIVINNRPITLPHLVPYVSRYWLTKLENGLFSQQFPCLTVDASTQVEPVRISGWNHPEKLEGFGCTVKIT